MHTYNYISGIRCVFLTPPAVLDLNPTLPQYIPSGSPYEYYTIEDADQYMSYAELILDEVRKFMNE